MNFNILSQQTVISLEPQLRKGASRHREGPRAKDRRAAARDPGLQVPARGTEEGHQRHSRQHEEHETSAKQLRRFDQVTTSTKFRR
jgi:hypothetical protein